MLKKRTHSVFEYSYGLAIHLQTALRKFVTYKSVFICTFHAIAVDTHMFRCVPLKCLHIDAHAQIMCDYVVQTGAAISYSLINRCIPTFTVRYVVCVCADQNRNIETH